jgi:hypothetical protein
MHLCKENCLHKGIMCRQQSTTPENIWVTSSILQETITLGSLSEELEIISNIFYFCFCRDESVCISLCNNNSIYFCLCRKIIVSIIVLKERKEADRFLSLAAYARLQGSFTEQPRTQHYLSLIPYAVVHATRSRRRMLCATRGGSWLAVIQAAVPSVANWIWPGVSENCSREAYERTRCTESASRSSTNPYRHIANCLDRRRHE